MALNNSSIKFETYINPCNEELYQSIGRQAYSDFILQEQRTREKAGVENFFGDFDYLKESSGEFLQKKYPFCLTESPEVSKWYNKITNWMPSDAEDWWLEQFEKNEALDSMPQEWWRLRARSFHVARDSDDGNKPVGALAVTKIYFDERFGNEFRHSYDNAVLYEPRGHVVAESYQGQGIGTGLWRTALRFITMSEEPLPTVAITTNEAEARLLKKEGGTNESSFEDLRYADNSLVCWARFESKPRFCDACPIKHNTAWWFPTHRRPALEDKAIEIKSSS
jgi:GNAT superfamily N-acetyltransferase